MRTNLHLSLHKNGVLTLSSSIAFCGRDSILPSTFAKLASIGSVANASESLKDELSKKLFCKKLELL